MFPIPCRIQAEVAAGVLPFYSLPLSAREIHEVVAAATLDGSDAGNDSIYSKSCSSIATEGDARKCEGTAVKTFLFRARRLGIIAGSSHEHDPATLRRLCRDLSRMHSDFYFTWSATPLAPGETEHAFAAVKKRADARRDVVTMRIVVLLA